MVKIKIAVFSLFLTMGAFSSHGGEAPSLEQARKNFETADVELNKTYSALCAELDARKLAELRRKQRAWIEFRDLQSESFPLFSTGEDIPDPKLSPYYWMEMAGLTRQRITFLRAYTGKNIPPGISGEYSNAYNNILEIEQRKSGVYFHIVAMSASVSHNTGVIDGVAKQEGNKAVFKDNPLKEEERARCEVTLTFIDDHIVKVESKNADFYLGHGAYFDGTYYKIGKFQNTEKSP